MKGVRGLGVGAGGLVWAVCGMGGDLGRFWLWWGGMGAYKECVCVFLWWTSFVCEVKLGCSE